MLYASGVLAWTCLLLVNIPWVVLVTLPCLLACQCPIAFVIISHMAGIHRRPDRAAEPIQ